MKKSSTEAPLRIGVFNTIEEADRAVKGLVEAGFKPKEISVICPSCSPEKYQQYHKTESAGSHTIPAALGGSAIGGVLGGLVAASAALTGGIALLAVGPLLLTAGMGAATGGFIGAMMTRGVEKEEANYYDQALQEGKILVSVEVDGPDHKERLAAAERFLAAAGAHAVALERG